MQVEDAVQSLLRDLIPPGHVAFDLGIGPGRITDVLQGRGFEVYGCDIDPRHSTAASARGVHADAADVLEWLPPLKADVITCMELIEHLPAGQQPALLGRMREWLAPGGTAILSTPQRHSVVAAVERAYSLVRRRPYDWWDPTHVAIRSRRQLVSMISAAGFTIERVVGLHLLPQLVTEVVGPLRRYEWTRHEGLVERACFDLTFVLKVTGPSRPTYR